MLFNNFFFNSFYGISAWENKILQYWAVSCGDTWLCFINYFITGEPKAGIRALITSNKSLLLRACLPLLLVVVQRQTSLTRAYTEHR